MEIDEELVEELAFIGAGEEVGGLARTRAILNLSIQEAFRSVRGEVIEESVAMGIKAVGGAKGGLLAE